ALRGGAEPAAPALPRLTAGARPRRRRWPALGLCTLAAGLLVLVLWPRPPAERSSAEEVAQAGDDTGALPRQAPGARWEGDGPRAGAALAPGWLRLRSGLAHIEFYSGATVILEAPAELKLVSRTEAYCARGKLRATVPPHAQGFTVGTPKLKLVDRGTEFGVHIGEEARAEVHVFQGRGE